MHILIIPSWYPVSEKDLKVSFIREQAESLLKYDANLNVGVLNSLLDDMYSFSGMPLFNRIIKTRENGLNVYRSKCLNWFRRVPFLGLKIWIYEGMKLAKRYIREHGKPDIIHAHFMFYGGLLAARVSKKYNIPLVITEHNSGYARGFVKQWQLNLGIKAFSQASQCIAVSKNFAAYLDKKYKLPNNSWVYIPNMVSDIFFEYPLGCKNSKKDYFTFTTICHLNSNKGVDVLIKAFAKCFNNKKQIRLVIGGDGNERSYLEKLVKLLKIEDQVDFLGKLSRKEVLLVLAKTDSYVLSSHYETFGIILAEALALGKPVISTNCGGPLSIVTKENGVLVEKGNVEEMTEGLSYLYDNISAYNSIEIRKDCANRFSEPVVIGQILSIYKGVIDNHRAVNKVFI